MADLFSIREKEIFKTLGILKAHRFVLIGGYAVNAYTLPRFSVDCDIVVPSAASLPSIGKLLQTNGYAPVEHPAADIPYHAHFMRYEKEIQPHFGVSVDILIGEVVDRLSGASFSFDWIVKNSTLRRLKGKTFASSIDLLIPSPDALFAMKFASCRETDIRDMFMLVSFIPNIGQLKNSISDKPYFTDNLRKLNSLISSKEFRDNLAGVYGYLDEQTFSKYQRAILKLG